MKLLEGKLTLDESKVELKKLNEGNICVRCETEDATHTDPETNEPLCVDCYTIRCKELNVKPVWQVRVYWAIDGQLTGSVRAVCPIRSYTGEYDSDKILDAFDREYPQYNYNCYVPFPEKCNKRDYSFDNKVERAFGSPFDESKQPEEKTYQLNKRDRIKYITTLTKELQKAPYNYSREEANDIALKRAREVDGNPAKYKGWDTLDQLIKKELDTIVTKDEYEKMLNEKMCNHKLNEEIDFDKHIWEGWTVGDFIEELEPEFENIMSGGSYIKPFKSKEELKKWTADNQPYYKKPIQDVVNYFDGRIKKEFGGYGLGESKSRRPMKESQQLNESSLTRATYIIDLGDEQYPEHSVFVEYGWDKYHGPFYVHAGECFYGSEERYRLFDNTYGTEAQAKAAFNRQVRKLKAEYGEGVLDTGDYDNKAQKILKKFGRSIVYIDNNGEVVIGIDSTRDRLSLSNAQILVDSAYHKGLTTSDADYQNYKDLEDAIKFARQYSNKNESLKEAKDEDKKDDKKSDKKDDKKSSKKDTEKKDKKEYEDEEDIDIEDEIDIDVEDDKDLPDVDVDDMLSLDDIDIDVDEPVIDEPTEEIPQEIVSGAKLGELQNAVRDEFGSIDHLKSLIATITLDDENAQEGDEDLIDVINGAIDLKYELIGMLNKGIELLDGETVELMDKGEERAEDILDDDADIDIDNIEIEDGDDVFGGGQDLEITDKFDVDRAEDIDVESSDAKSLFDIDDEGIATDEIEDDVVIKDKKPNKK